MLVGQILAATVIVVTGIISVILLKVAIRLIKANEGEYEQNRLLCRRFSDGLFGRVRVPFRTPDFRVRAGIAVDTETNTWVTQGTWSDDAIRNLLAPHDRK